MPEHPPDRGATPRGIPDTTLILAWALALILAFVSYDLIRSSAGYWILREGGGIESVSAVLLAVCALLYVRGRGAGRDWHVSVGLLLLSMRELDFDKRFTNDGVLQLRLYSGDNPVVEKAIGAAVILLILVVLVRLARYQLRPWVAALWRRSAWAWLFAAAGVLIVVAKSLDGIARKLAPLGIQVPEDLSALSSRVEELFELYFALALLVSLAMLLKQEKT